MNPNSRQVMNPPADEAEAGNLANTAPRQSDSHDARRGETELSCESEARPVTLTARYQCACPTGKCQPEKNVGSYCWRSGFSILASDFPDAVGGNEP